MRINALIRLVAATLLLFLMLIQPNHPQAMTWAALTLFPLELPVLIFGLIALPATSRMTSWVRLGMMTAIMLIVILKLADFATFVAYSRGFNPVVDLHLIPAAMRLSAGSLGMPIALVTVAGLLLGLCGIGWSVWWATGVWSRVEPVANRMIWRTGATLGAGIAAVIAGAEVGQARGAWQLPVQMPGAAFTARVGVERIEMARRTNAELRNFAAAAQTDIYRDTPGLLDRVRDRDVLIIYVESYGRASMDERFYAQQHLATLVASQISLAGVGLEMRSGWLTAPMIGGQSWLTHATIASGLWIPDQTRYRALIASPRKSLFHFATDAGFHTAAVMPALTYDWPEGPRMGFQTVLAADDLGYNGPAFNWVTIPDQFTLAALDRFLRNDPAGDSPLFAQVALISSHAPWTPVPELVAWEDLGDGQVFARWKDAGDAPEVVWQDPARVRYQYRTAVNYALKTAFSYAERTAKTAPLIIIMGDHQTADFISGSDSFDVPAHFIGPPEALAPIAAWGWTDGLIPSDTVPSLPMDKFRDKFVASYSSDISLARTGTEP